VHLQAPLWVFVQHQSDDSPRTTMDYSPLQKFATTLKDFDRCQSSFSHGFYYGGIHNVQVQKAISNIVNEMNQSVKRPYSVTFRNGEVHVTFKEAAKTRTRVTFKKAAVVDEADEAEEAEEAEANSAFAEFWTVCA
jgi:hypothetical protein